MLETYKVDLDGARVEDEEQEPLLLCLELGLGFVRVWVGLVLL